MKKQQKNVFFIKNTDRKDAFLLDTRIVLSGENNYSAEKHASTKEAEKHLNNLINNYKALSSIKNLNKIVAIIPAEKVSEDTVKFPYIRGRSAERIALEQIVGGHYSEALDTIGIIFSVIDSMPTIKVSPAKHTDYVGVFGSSFSQTTDCIVPGIIDLNLDNFIVDDAGKWHMFDYEWCFDFPVPKDFLKIRVLWYLLSRHKEILEYHYSTFDGAKIIAERILVPNFIYNRFAELFKTHTTNFLKTEVRFQKYVTRSSSGELTRFKASEDMTLIADSKEPLIGVERFSKLVNEKYTNSINKELVSQKKKYAVLKKHIESIEKSKSYKLSRLLSKLNPKSHS